MYSLKPGRGPSLIGAVVALVIGVPFCIFWISIAVTKHAPVFFVFFGLAFLVLTLVMVGMGFYNATSRNRISQYDITSSGEERDPFERLASSPTSGSDPGSASAGGAHPAEGFCPFCGAKLDRGFNYCPKCGKPQAQPGGS